MLTERDVAWMTRAVRLARRGFPAPNPHVGAVLVQEETLVGEGYHPFAGAPHAEIFAIQQAGARAHSATLYVTLEPCCHYGRTPPCTNAVIDAGIRRVVVGMQDPNPKVAGKGLQQLREAGIQVDLLPSEHPLVRELEQLNRAFLHRHRTGRPLITLKAALSMDGKIACHTGDSKWITGERARRYAHRLRAEHGAVLVGVGTVLKDDPQLTARLSGVRNQPLRVVLDTHLRTPSRAQVLNTQHAPTVIFCGAPAPSHADTYCERGVEVVAVPTKGGRVDLTAVIDHLIQRKVIGVLVEGGSRVHTALLEARLADRIAFFYAPILIGGQDAPTPFEGVGAPTVAQAVRVVSVQQRRFGHDWLVEGGLEYKQ
ncbi:MAG: bifunctional diaminohydroxyphosphoribosylaminopyrimidine deaminase/5-amino-6-(5-phosphoribosylamino)uracil reductase RibD [Fimbriimonadales bacterium]